MTKRADTLIIPDVLVMNKIYFIRSKKVMIDSDLSILYQVETKRLNEQVNRNIERVGAQFAPTGCIRPGRTAHRAACHR